MEVHYNNRLRICKRLIMPFQASATRILPYFILAKSNPTVPLSLIILLNNSPKNIICVLMHYADDLSTKVIMVHNIMNQYLMLLRRSQLLFLVHLVAYMLCLVYYRQYDTLNLLLKLFDRHQLLLRYLLFPDS